MSRSIKELSTQVRELRNDAQIALFQINQLKKENKQLRAALERIRDCDFVITLPDRMDAVRAIAREALE